MNDKQELLIIGDCYYKYIGEGFSEAITGDVFIHEVTGECFEITVNENLTSQYDIDYPIRIKDEYGEEDGYRRQCKIHSLYRKIQKDGMNIENKKQSVSICETKDIKIVKGKKELFLESYKSSVLINLTDLHTLEENFIDLNKEEVIKVKSFLEEVLEVM